MGVKTRLRFYDQISAPSWVRHGRAICLFQAYILSRKSVHPCAGRVAPGITATAFESLDVEQKADVTLFRRRTWDVGTTHYNPRTPVMD